MSKSTFFWITGVVLFLTGSGLWLWSRFGPTTGRTYQPKLEDFPIARTLDSSSSACNLVIRRYKQIGDEMQFELAADAGGLSPYHVEISQKGKVLPFENIPHRYGVWLSIQGLNLQTGPAEIKVVSLGQAGCQTSAAFEFDAGKIKEIPDAQTWIRQGSKDNWLDVRPTMIDGKLHLKDFGNYTDGRTKVVMIDGIEVKGLENGIPVKPGYLYSIIARWIDAPYNDWWNKMRNRSLRQQNIWLSGKLESKEETKLTRIAIPEWFSPSKTINVDFDTKFPEFEPIKGKLVMQYRLNDYVPTENYYKRGINYLSGGKDTPAPRMHYTATPNYFADKDEKWFGSLSKEEAETWGGVPNFGVYALDFEFWNQHYTPEVKQRLIWFANRIRKNNPDMYLMDYWGGGAYTNPHINTLGGKKPSELYNDYNDPKSNNSNFEPLENGDNFNNLFNATPIDVYPKPMFVKDEKGNTPNNFVLLSAIHSLRINKLIPYQKDNKFIFFGWNRYMPLYHDPIVPWNFQLTEPKGELVMNQLEMMPASQALSMSLFSLILFDGYYLWHDGGPSSNDINAHKVGGDASPWGHEWYPADGKTPETEVGKKPFERSGPTYWDFPTEFYSLGNWMAKQVEDVIVGGTNQDLAFKLNGNWVQPKKEQVLLAIEKKEPFVTAIVKGNKIVVLGVDSFQAPNATRNVKVKLPDGTETSIELYGNWPSLYRGTLKK